MFITPSTIDDPIVDKSYEANLSTSPFYIFFFFSSFSFKS